MIAGTSGPWGIARMRRQAMKKMMLLVAMLTMMMMLASPALAQNDKLLNKSKRPRRLKQKPPRLRRKATR
jgi:hypothetical protein